MIGLPPGTKVFLACQPIDLRAGFDGLAAKVQQIIGADPFSGHVFIFRSKRGHLSISAEAGPAISVE
jgi:transposase